MTVYDDYSSAISAERVKSFLGSDLARYVSESMKHTILKSYYTGGVITNSAGHRNQLKRILLDSGSTLDLVNEDVALRLELQIIPTLPRTLSVADGYRVTTTGRTWVTLTLEGVITQGIPVLVMKGDTPYSLLIGNWGLFVFNAETKFHPLPTTWTISQTPDGDRVPATRDNEAELQANVRKAVEAAKTRRATHPFDEGAGKRRTGKQVRFETAILSDQPDTSDNDTDEGFVELTNQLAQKILDEAYSDEAEVGYDTDMSELQMSSGSITSSVRG